MSEKIEKPNQYIGMAIGFQRSYMQILDKILSESIDSQQQAREIVSMFSLNFAVFLDQCWHDSPVGKVYPTVAFSYEHRDAKPEKYLLNNGLFSFVDLVEKNLSWYYDEQGDKEEPQSIGVPEL